jgi:hypothetical protein
LTINFQDLTIKFAGMQVPPGRQFLLRPSKAVKNTDWDFREVPSECLSRFYAPEDHLISF